jgi:hypothetical protein
MNVTEMSADLFELLNGKNLETKQHEAIMLLTVNEDMWPHTAMISFGEIVAITHSEVRLALWPGTLTISNLHRTGKATLVIVFAGKAHYLRLAFQEIPPLKDVKHMRERFSGTVLFMKEDTAKYADITSGIKIKLKDSADVIKRWNETIEELLM